MGTAARKGDFMVYDAPEVIEQWRGISPPTRMVIGDRTFVAPGVHKLACKPHGRGKDRRAMTERAEPATAKEHFYLYRDRNAAS